MNSDHISFFRSVVGDQYVLTGKPDLAAYGRDWTRTIAPDPAVAVLPRTTAEVSAIVAYCFAHDLAIVPSGGRTGLAGGAVASRQEVVISLHRMTQILNVDPVGLTVKVQAGVTTEQVQVAAEDVGLFFPLDLAAKGSCHIGGNIATNAGGVKFIRYGGMREQVLGLEVVLPDGKVLDMNTGLRKNNTGYDLKQLFIGSEGTLGIITAATLKLAARPRGLQVSLVAVHSFADIPAILRECNLGGHVVTAFEFFTHRAHELVIRFGHGLKSPFSSAHNYYVLIELESADAGETEVLLEKLFEKGLIQDAVIAGSSAQAKELWSHRENISESIAAHGHALKNDISLEVAHLSEFLTAFDGLLSQQTEKIDTVVFGHIGDGNLHVNYIAPSTEDQKAFLKKAKPLETRVFDLLARFRGSISAEHGIGLLKKADLRLSRTLEEISMMRSVKKSFDPKGIMNPGKIFDL